MDYKIYLSFITFTGGGNEVYVKDGYAYVTDADTGQRYLSVKELFE